MTGHEPEIHDHELVSATRTTDTDHGHEIRARTRTTDTQHELRVDGKLADNVA